MPKLTDKAIKQCIDAVRKHGGNQAAAAYSLGLNRNTLASRLRDAKTRGFSIPVRPEENLAVREQADEAAALRTTVSSLQRQIIAERVWRRRFESLEKMVDRPTKLAKPNIKPKKTEHVVQLFTSDFQCGERIFPSQIDGINEYNGDIFATRYQKLIDSTIDLASNHTGLAEFPGIVYLAGGDAISGQIHEELAETNDLSSVPAVRLLCQQERDGIRRLRDHFGHVRVYRIPGNHGRTTKKPRSKGYVEHNYETLLSWWLASTFDDDPRVEFVVPPSGDAYYDVLGWKFLMSHGDRMGSRGGQGFIGPAATIIRGHTKLHANFSATGRHCDMVLTGHLHTELKLERGLANGALAGYSEYARDLRATPDAARQWMFTTHRDRPTAHLFSIQLSPMPKRSDVPD